MRFFLLVLMLVPGPVAAADYCHEMWFNRNLIYDRAGYCFGSALGQAVFDNSDCTGTEVTLSAADQALVNAIRAEERTCKVDTGGTVLNVHGVAFRKEMIDLPMPVADESACVGWLGEPLPLRLGHSAEAPVGAMAERGDNLLYQFADVGDWSFVEAFRDGEVVGVGWAPYFDWGELCEMVAG